MKPIEKEIIHFLEMCHDCYTNPHNVDFVTEDNGICTTSWWIQRLKLHISIGAFMEHDSMQRFITDFNITSVKDLGKITHEHLMEFYLAGRACLFCYVGDYCLFYKKKNDKMVVIDDTLEYELPAVLSKPSEFISHTRDYFGML